MRRMLLWCGIGLVSAGCGMGDAAGPRPETTLSATPTESGNDQFGRTSSTLPLPLRVVVDSVGTKKAGVTVTWHASGGLLVSQGVTDAAGIATATWTLDAVAGAKSATATAAGLNTVTFGATALAGPTVFLYAVARQSFVSAQNGSTGPAVDTIPAGRAMTWILRDSDGNLHRVVSVGSPSFKDSGLLTAAYDALRVSVTFAQSGTYHYADNGTGATGIVVVQ